MKFKLLSRNIVFLLLLFVACDNVKSQSQHPYTDSLINIINSEPADSILTAALRSVIWNNLGYDSNLALEYSEQLKAQGIRLKDDYLIAKSDHYNGIAYRYLGQYEESITSLDKCIAHFRSTNNIDNLINPLFHLGVTHSLAGDYRKSMDAYFEQLDIATTKNDTINIGTCHNSIGILYKNLEDYEKANEHYKKASSFLSLSEKGIPDLAMTLINRANVFLITNQLDSALHYNQQSTILESKIERFRGLAFNYNQRADIFQKLLMPDSVLHYLEQSNLIYQKLNLKMGLGLNLISISRHYNELGNYSQGAKTATSAYSIMKEVGSLTEQQDALLEIINAKAGLKNYQEAYEYQNQWIDLRDTIQNSKNKEILEELNLKYETAEKDLALSANQLKLQEQKSQRNQLIALALGLLGLLTSVYFYYMQRLSKNKKIAQKEKEIAQQRITQLEKEQKINNMSSMIEGQEAERRRIAKDLHDGLGGLLATVRTKMGQIESTVREIEDLNVYKSTNEMIDQACDEVRRISHNMMPGVLRIEGIEGAVEDLADQLIQVHNIKVDLNLNFDQQKLNEAQAHMIYRIIQEACNNVIKHSEASELILQVIDYDDHINVLIEDNGIGFNTNGKSEGLGLQSIQARVDFLNGGLDLTSSEQGTSMSINVPIQ